MWTANKYQSNVNNEDSQLFETDNLADFQKRMNECNKQGLFPIHEAAYKGYVNAVRRFVELSKDRAAQIELETKDEQQSTPILLAGLGSNIDVIELLLEFGAKIDARNINGHGLVEIAGMRQDLKLLNFLLNLPDSGINVWKRLIQAFASDFDDVSSSIGRTIEKLTELPPDRTHENAMAAWKKTMKNFIDNEFLVTMCKVFQLKSKETLISAFLVFLNYIEYVEIEKAFDLNKQYIKAGGMQVLSQFLKSDNANQFAYDNDLICLCGKVLSRLSSTIEMCQSSFSVAIDLTQNIYQNILKLLQKLRNANTLFSYLDFVTNLLKFSKSINIQIPNLGMLVSALIPLYRECNDSFHMFNSLLKLTLAISRESNELQSQFVKEGLTAYLALALKHSSPQLKELAIKCTEVISKTNVYVQKVMAKGSVLVILLSFLQKSPSYHHKVLTTNALWSLAGDDPIQRKMMATKIRVPVLVDFLSLKSDDLYFIACDALHVLFCQPPNVNVSIHDQFLELHGTNALVRVLTNDKEIIVLAVIRCLQRLCVRAGLNPFKQGQNEIKKYNGITFLVALLIHAKQEQIKAEAALTLAHICLENQANMEITTETLDFSYLYVYKLLKSKSSSIQLLALSALALFGYNNLPQQRLMANVGAIPISTFEPFLMSKDDFEKCEAAFQITVLSNIILDEQPATSSAEGIKILMDVLNSNVSSTKSKILAAEKLSILGRLKNGVSDAIVSIEGIRVLCDNCYTDNENLQGTCAIALSNFTHNNEGRRKLLNKCRHDPGLIDILKFYNEYNGSKQSLSSQFYHEWKHYQNVGLPALNSSRAILNKNGQIIRAKVAAEAEPIIKTVTFDDSTINMDQENYSQGNFQTDSNIQSQETFSDESRIIENSQTEVLVE